MRSNRLRIALLGDGEHINIQRWNKGLRMAGAETVIVSFHRRGEPKSEDIHYLKHFSFLGRANYIVALSAIRGFLLKWRPDIVLAYYVTGYGTLAHLSGFRPLVQVTSGSDILIAPRNPIMRLLVQRNLMHADLVTAWAPHMAQAAYANGANKVFVLPAGIETEAFLSHRTLKPKPDDVLRLIITRGLKAFYRIDRLIEAVYALKVRGHDVSLTIAGDGPERAKLAAMIKSLNLERQVHLVGKIPNDKLPLLLAKHNMYISLVPSDGVSASLLEAMAVGLVPVVPNHISNRDWITDGENGLLIEEFSPEAIADCIENATHNVRICAWMDNPRTIANRADLRLNSEKYIEEFQKLVDGY